MAFCDECAERQEQDGLLSVNIKRGLNRLFVVLATCWYVMALLVIWPQWKVATGVPISAMEHRTPASASLDTRHSTQDWFEANAPWSQTPDRKFWCKPQLGLCYPDSAWFHSPDTFIPDDPPPKPIGNTAFFAAVPLAIYGFGLVAAWVLRGFRAGNRSVMSA